MERRVENQRKTYHQELQIWIGLAVWGFEPLVLVELSFDRDQLRARSQGCKVTSVEVPAFH